jgi:hypothetical protein
MIMKLIQKIANLLLWCAVASIFAYKTIIIDDRPNNIDIEHGFVVKLSSKGFNTYISHADSAIMGFFIIVIIISISVLLLAWGVDISNRMNRSKKLSKWP